MERSEPVIEGNVAVVDELTLAQLAVLDERDSVLANSIRRIRDVVERPAEGVSAFNSAI